jgi:hypothetical protein
MQYAAQEAPAVKPDMQLVARAAGSSYFG